MATDRPELEGAAALVLVHLRGGDPDEVMARLIAERMRIALST